MGNSCLQIKQNSFKKNSNILLNIKLPKLRDFFASYKSICDNFSIDLIQFQHIFGAGQSSFVIWDTDNNGLIDALQLFAGIAVFSDTKLQDKVRFLFDVFDFNQVQYLQPIELEFMIVCVVNAAFKIYGITTQPANQEIQDFVRELFFQTNKITVADLIKKSKQTKKYNNSLIQQKVKNVFLQIENLMKSFYISQKKDQYIKHIKRLQVIYNNGKSKQNLKKQLLTMDRLISNSHRIHEISNRSKFFHGKQNQISHTSRDWNSVHSHVNSFPKDLGKFSIPKIQKNKKQKYDLNKKILIFQNDCSKLNQQQIHQNRNLTLELLIDYLQIINQIKMVISQIFQICPIQKKNNIQNCVLEQIHSKIIIKTQIPERFAQMNQSECFSLKQLLKGQLLIYKRKNDQIKMIQIRQLILNEKQSISKGHLNFKGFLNENDTQPDQYIQFFSTSGKRTTTILVHIQKRNIKKKINRFSHTLHNPNNNTLKQIQNQNSNPTQA